LDFGLWGGFAFWFKKTLVRSGEYFFTAEGSEDATFLILRTIKPEESYWPEDLHVLWIQV
jgi:hypothetical protein